MPSFPGSFRRWSVFSVLHRGVLYSSPEHLFFGFELGLAYANVFIH